MPSVLTAKDALRMLQTITLQTIAVAISMGAGLCQAEGHKTNRNEQPYCGAATVSVATLQVPEQAWKHFEKARAMALKHNVADAERESAKALAIAPKFAAAHILQASQQLLLNDYDAALQNVIAAKRIDPDTEWAGVVLAGAYNGLHRYNDALNTIDDLHGREAESWQAKYEDARAMVGMGDKEAALKLSAEALELAPKDFLDAKLMRANALIIAHRWSDAKDCLSEYLAAPGPQIRREQVLKALAMVAQKAKADESGNLASR